MPNPTRVACAVASVAIVLLLGCSDAAARSVRGDPSSRLLSADGYAAAGGDDDDDSAGSHTGWPQFGGNAQKTGRFAGPLSTNDGIQWAFDTGNQVTTTTVLTADGSLAVFTDTGVNVYGVVIPTSPPSLKEELFSGIRSPNLKWKYVLDAAVGGAPALSANDTFVFVGDAVGGLYCIETATGTLRWKSLIDRRSLASPITTSPDGKALFVGSLSAQMFSVSQQTGDVLWSCTAGGAVIGAPVVSTDGSMMYFSSSDTYVYGVSLTDNKCAGIHQPPCRQRGVRAGCSTWSQALDTNPIDHGPMLDEATNTLYVATSGDDTGGGTVFGLTLSEGSAPSRVYAVANLTQKITSGPALITAGTIAFGAADGKLHAINVAVDPAVALWSHTSGGQAVVSKPVSNGVHVAYGSISMEVYVVSAATGEELVRVDVGGEVTASPAINEVGWIVIGDNSGLVWSIGGTSPDLIEARLVFGIGCVVLLILMCICVYCSCCRLRSERQRKSLLKLSASPYQGGDRYTAYGSSLRTGR